MGCSIALIRISGLGLRRLLRQMSLVGLRGCSSCLLDFVLNFVWNMFESVENHEMISYMAGWLNVEEFSIINLSTSLYYLAIGFLIPRYKKSVLNRCY